jgi:glycosyltransferase involved in cell wall biosynthesis
MKVLHLNAGNETGGGMVHILSLLKQLNRDEFYLGLFENGTFALKAKEMDINTIIFGQSTRYDLSVLGKIIRFIKQEKIDILHTHGARANLYGYFLKKLTNVTWITTIHSDPRNDFLGRGIIGKIFTKLNLMVLKKPDHYFAISERFSEMMSSFGVNPNKITTILNGIDFNKKTEMEFSRSELKLSHDDFVILMVARFDPVKRHELAISAVQKMVETTPNVKLLLVGDGPSKPAIEEFVREKGLENNVYFLGYQENVAPFYKVADITLLTSKTESFPLVLLESSREKTPVITTDVGGVQTMIPDRTYGIILRNDTVEEIVKELNNALELKKQGELKKMGERFYLFTSRNFSVQAFADSIYKVYKGFTAGKK